LTFGPRWHILDIDVGKAPGPLARTLVYKEGKAGSSSAILCVRGTMKPDQ